MKGFVNGRRREDCTAASKSSKRQKQSGEHLQQRGREANTIRDEEGVAAVLLTRGPEAMLPQGAVLEMALNRDLVLRAEEWSGGATGAPLAPR